MKGTPSAPRLGFRLPVRSHRARKFSVLRGGLVRASTAAKTRIRQIEAKSRQVAGSPLPPRTLEIAATNARESRLDNLAEIRAICQTGHQNGQWSTGDFPARHACRAGRLRSSRRAGRVFQSAGIKGVTPGGVTRLRIFNRHAATRSNGICCVPNWRRSEYSIVTPQLPSNRELTTTVSMVTTISRVPLRAHLANECEHDPSFQAQQQSVWMESFQRTR